MKHTLDIYKILETLKGTVRHSYLSNGLQERVGGHCWSSMFLAFYLSQFLERRVDMFTVYEMLLVHDLAEATTGDTPAHENHLIEDKFGIELEAMMSMKSTLRSVHGRVLSLWNEFEHGISASPEAGFAQAIDKLDGAIQHLSMPDEFVTDAELESEIHYRPAQLCTHEPALLELALSVGDAIETKHKKIKEDRIIYGK